MNKYIKNMLETLRAAGATSVVISFDGSGDSGSIESVQIYEGAQLCNLNYLVTYPTEKSTWINDQWVTETEEKEMSITDALEAYCYDELEKTGVDWYNNDGGFGDMQIDLGDTVSVELEVSQRYTEYHTTSFNLTEELEED
jgi:hypothetical protein